MNRSAIQSKSATKYQIAICTIVLDINSGHLKWQIAELARKAGVSRTIIYRYFGGSKIEILRKSIHIFYEHNYNLEDYSTLDQLPAFIIKVQQTMCHYPDVNRFYLKWRFLEAPLKAEFLAIEDTFYRKLKKLFPACPDQQILAIQLCIYAMTTAPFLSSKDIHVTFNFFLKKQIFEV